MELSSPPTNTDTIDESKQPSPQPPLTRPDRISQWLLKWFDFLIYTLLFIIGIPIYFTTGYELPYQLATAVLLFRACMLLSARKRRFLHPILISFSLSLLVFYIFTLIHTQSSPSFKTSIKHYKTGRNYLHLFQPQTYPRWPGAGDVLLSLMDVSIVSLSLAMYNYRSDLRRYFFSLLPPIIVATFMSLFIHPPLCHALGISPERSLGFTGRSVTMALGTPLVQALGGSVQLMAVTTILSGIFGVLCGDFIIFKMFRVRENDFVSRGVSMGVTCGAVSTAHLLTVDSRAAAISSLSFTLFGTFMVVLSAVNPIVRLLRDWVGL
ncbi:unnamed protein product [Ambrosiozyma monospora]|uniref:Unnamed protein product n=1 Tax=Ambrosiozyma monospora TaxID=43982 RepID=A0ACB5T472_AMBMO|nr:unnamed protein product [Ambrosiozyma monospora]